MRLSHFMSLPTMIVLLLLGTSLQASAQPTMIPSSAARYDISGVSVGYLENSQDYLFSNLNGQPEVDYMFSLGNPRSSSSIGILNLRASVDSRHTYFPFYQGGFYVRNATGVLLDPQDVATQAEVTIVNHGVQDNRVIIDYAEVIDGETLTKQYVLELIGNTLVMQLSDTTIQDTTAQYVGFHFGKARFIRDGKILELPGMPFPVIEGLENVYMSTYVDPLLSNLSRYEETREDIRGRIVTACNTPAWMAPEALEAGERMRVTAYFTLGNHWTDVLPVLRRSNSSTPKPSLVIDVSEAPLARSEALPYHVVRRWESPNNGRIDLDAQFELEQGSSAIIEVSLIEQSSPDTPRLLFSQMLNRGQKPVTAIEGEFPIQKGDQLLFTHKGPHSVSGGHLKSDIRIRLGNILYDCQYDFGPEQGEHQWYFEEVIQGERSPMLWNPQRGRWESLQTRAYQTADSLVSLSAPPGDAYKNAEAFLDQIDRMGVRNFHLMARGWNRNATDDIEAAPEYWGKRETLNRIHDNQNERGNTVLFDIPQSTIISTAVQALMAGEPAEPIVEELPEAPPEPTSPMTTFLQSLGEHISDAQTTGSAEGVMIQIPHPSRFGSLLPYDPGMQQFGPEGSSQTVRNLAAWADTLRAQGNPLFAELIGFPELDTILSAAGTADAIFAPYIPPATPGFIFDAYLRLQSDLGWVGLGGYNTFVANQMDSGPIDPRFFPMDLYHTYTLLLRRIPQVSGRVWYPSLTSRQQRKHWLESISLLQPVAEQYSEPGTTVEEIHYLEEDDWAVDLPTLLARERIEPIDHIRVQYSNNLIVYANTGNDIWRVLGIGLIQDRIAPGGFLAINGKAGLISIIGRRYDRPFSACVTQDYIFINSRDRELFEYEPFATDGMCRVNRTGFANRWDLVALDATEVLETEALQPLFRSNQRMDLIANWITPQRIEIEVLDISEGENLLDWFVLPDAEVDESTIQVLRERHDGEQDTVETTPIRSGLREGIRMTGIQRGDRLILTRSLPGTPGT